MTPTVRIGRERRLGDKLEENVGSDTAPAFQSDPDEPVVGQANASGEATGESTVVKICKSCMVSQSDGGQFCVRCGRELVPIRAVRDSYIGEVVGDKYKLVDRLGAGGMGEVYLGLNEPLGQRVAVKFLSQKFSADESIIMRFLNEARSYCKVNHPNAVTLLEYGQHDDGGLYLITEFIEGKSLTDTLKDVGPLRLDQVISVATQVCEVLAAAHQQGVIHRDLKPDNIMLMPTSRGRYAVKVLDFGIAKIVDDDHDNGPMTETGSVFGTPEFMSPEQARGDTVDPRADLYAVGIILFYITTGKLPFKGKSKLVVLNKQLNERPPRPAEAREDISVSLRLESVILKCLNKQPDQRYQSADDLLEALEEANLAEGTAPTPGVGGSRLSAVSSDISDSAADTPGRSPSTDHRDIHANETVAYEVDMPLDTDPKRAASVDLGQLHESADSPDDLAEVDMASEWTGRRAGSVGSDGQGKRLAMAVGLLVVVGVAVWRLTTSESADPPSEAHRPVDINHVLKTGQVIGSLSAARDNLAHGDLRAAQRVLRATYQWADDGALPEEARSRRKAMKARLGRVQRQVHNYTMAVAAGNCATASDIRNRLDALEAAAVARGLDECDPPPEHPPTGGVEPAQPTAPRRPKPTGSPGGGAEPEAVDPSASPAGGDGQTAGEGADEPTGGRQDKANHKQPTDDEFGLPPRTLE